MRFVLRETALEELEKDGLGWEAQAILGLLPDATSVASGVLWTMAVDVSAGLISPAEAAKEYSDLLRGVFREPPIISLR